MDYILVVGSIKTVQERVAENLRKGYVLYGNPFRSGNRILQSGDPAYPGTCEFTSEIVQPMTRFRHYIRED